MKQLKKHYALTLILGMIAALAVVVFLGIGAATGDLIPWAVVIEGAPNRFGVLNISYRYLLNIFLCFGKSGWTWDFARIAIPGVFWAAVLGLVLSIVFSVKKGNTRNILPLIFIFLNIAGSMWVLEGIVYAQSIGAMRLRYAFSFAFCIGGGITSVFLCLLALLNSHKLANAELAAQAQKANDEKFAALEAKIAELEAKAVVVAPVVEEVAVEEDDAKGGLNIQRIPFEVKLANAEEDIKAKYAELAGYITDTYGIKARQSIAGVSFSAHREKLVFVTIIGKHLRTNYALDIKDYNDSTLPVTMSENKKYQDTPLTLKVKSDLSLRRAKGLVDDVMAAKGIEKIVK